MTLDIHGYLFTTVPEDGRVTGLGPKMAFPTRTIVLPSSIWRGKGDGRGGEGSGVEGRGGEGSGEEGEGQH